jgi:cell division protein FtsN
VDPNQKLNQSPDEMNAAGSEGPVDTIDSIVKRVTAGTSDAEPARDASGKAVAPGQVKTSTLWVQAGAFKSQDRAQNVQAQLAMLGIQADLSRAGNVWRVRVGPFDTPEQAREIQDQIRNADDSIGTSIVEK